jgi:hypothetical protein
MCLTCNQAAPIANQDKNLFATTVNAQDMITLLKQVKSDSSDEVEKIAEGYQRFIGALKHKLTRPQDCPRVPGSAHQVQTNHGMFNQPEVFCLNFQWIGKPTPMDILRLLVSIPNQFQPHNLFYTLLNA